MLFAPNTSSSVVDRLGLTEDSRNLLRYESPSQYLDPNIAGKYAAQKLIAFTVIGVRLASFLILILVDGRICPHPRPFCGIYLPPFLKRYLSSGND